MPYKNHPICVVARLEITTGFVVWHASNKLRDLQKLFDSRPLILGTSKVTLVKPLKAETYAAPTQLNLSMLQLHAYSRYCI